MVTKRKSKLAGLSAQPSGSQNERYIGLSFIQLRIPQELHYEFRRVLLERRLSVNSVAEDVVRVFLDFLEDSLDYVPSERHNMTTRPLKKRGRKRKKEEPLLVESS